MPKLSDIAIVRLAIGWRSFPETGTGVKTNLLDQIKLSEDKALPERARKIVLREIVRLTRGENVDDEMRRLIGWWASQQLNGGKRGRRKNWTKEAAIYLTFKTLIEKNPEVQRKVIIAFLAEKFGVKQRRIYEAIKRQQPRKSPPLEDLLSSWEDLLRRVRPGAEREKLEALYKQLGRLHQRRR
jgi:hypothetical protein